MHPQSSPPWDSRRWTDTLTPSVDEAGHRQNFHPGRHPHYFPEPTAPPLSAPSAINLAAHGSIVERFTSSDDACAARSCEMDPPMRHLPWLTEPYDPTTEASTCHPRHYERHLPNSRHPPQPTDSANRETSSSWRQSLYDYDRRLSVVPNAPQQLTLHIPPAKDMPRIKPSHSAINSEKHDYNALPALTTATSLPSFAAFKEHSTRVEDVADPEIASMSQRHSCSNCSRLIPLVKDVTAVVLELDDDVQSYCNKALTRTQEPPHDDSFRAVQWIIEKLRNAKNDLQDAARRNYGGFSHQNASAGSEHRNSSPPNPLKRPAEQWERDDVIRPKRPRSGESNDYSLQLPALTPRDERRASIDFAARDPRFGLSPPPGGTSTSNSMQTRTTSPTFAHRLNIRALPSPSPMAYPPSAAPSLAPQAPSISSPATSYQPTSSIHTASSSSATSAHIADLQHQVTLKSLALQTLQSEYASLLQKLQRERVKSQTIEKKTSVADQEVNELTGKNEELTEQVKLLETALEQSEKKREALGAESAREKEQWSRMLDMSGRLQAKVDKEKAMLLEEKALLERQLTVRQARPDEASRGQTAGLDRPDMKPASLAATSTESSRVLNENEHTLELRVRELHERAQTLRSALEQAQKSNRQLVESMESTLATAKLANSTVEDVLDEKLVRRQSTPAASSRHEREDDGLVHPISTLRSRDSAPLPPPPSQQFSSSPSSTRNIVSTASDPVSVTRVVDSPGQPKGTLDVYENGKRFTAKISEVARAVSPGPEELGFYVAPTTLGPEELIQALGPVPSPQPPLGFTPQANEPPETTTRHVTDHHRRGKNISPHSSHSSPGLRGHGALSPSLSENRSPEQAYASDPELTTITMNEWRGNHSPSAAPLVHSHRHVMQHAPTLATTIPQWVSTMPSSRTEPANLAPRTFV